MAMEHAHWISSSHPLFWVTNITHIARLWRISDSDSNFNCLFFFPWDTFWILNLMLVLAQRERKKFPQKDETGSCLASELSTLRFLFHNMGKKWSSRFLLEKSFTWVVPHSQSPSRGACVSSVLVLVKCLHRLIQPACLEWETLFSSSIGLNQLAHWMSWWLPEEGGVRRAVQLKVES